MTLRTGDTVARALVVVGCGSSRRRTAKVLGGKGEIAERKREHERRGGSEARMPCGAPRHEKRARGSLEGRRRRGGVHGVALCHGAAWQRGEEDDKGWRGLGLASVSWTRGPGKWAGIPFSNSSVISFCFSVSVICFAPNKIARHFI